MVPEICLCHFAFILSIPTITCEVVEEPDPAFPHPFLTEERIYLKGVELEVVEMDTSSAESGADYQVFLSFRGPDTRQGFTDCLYHFLTNAGIRVFKDDTDQSLGAKITEILAAINRSVICIPIFSKGYASSKWCLRELHRMVKLEKTIIPIFYDVKPDDVKLQTSLYVDALAEFEPEDVKEWREALKEVVTRSGRELKRAGFGEFCTAITSEVLTKLKAKDKVITCELVAINDQVKAVTELLDVDSPDVRFIGIHGMGGIGKTTLAKLVFNELSYRFDYCSFIDDIRELSKGEATKLQTKLLVDLLRKFSSVSDNDDGVKKIREVLHDKKVLIVLDDVDHREQINRLAGNSSWFGSGSRIIITTRDKSVIESEPLRKIKPYTMMEMDYYQALQLFSKQAFKEDSPPNDFLDLSKEVISVTGKLPLALEIIGSHLHGKHRDVWRENIRMLARIPHKDVQKKLRLSYDSLDHRAQQIFLDIACFFNNTDKTNAIYMWEACKFHPESAIQDLVSMSLIKLNDHDKYLWMHDQLRDLGREIVCLEDFMDFGRRSRLWEHEEAIGILKRGEGTRRIHALCASEAPFAFGYEELQCLRNLRFLEWSGIKVQGDLKKVFSKLIWLSWYDCPAEYTATNLNLESLVILELSRSSISESWLGWSNIQVGDDLKVLDLTGCKNVTQTPDLSKYRTLERLILEDCVKLVAIDGSIGNLKSLKYLNVKGCHSLRSFPEELSSLDTLEVIIMKGAGGEFRLPGTIGKLRSLVVLEIVKVQIHEVPHSIGQLQKLEQLSFSGCSGIKELPVPIGSLNSLEKLDLSETSIQKLPDSIRGLTMLQYLHLDRCKGLYEVPDSLGCLKSLIELDLSWTKVTNLPNSVGKLSELKVMKVVNTMIKELPGTVISMVKLEELHASGCHSLETVPEEIQKLPSLRILDFSACDGIIKVPSLSEVSSLQTLLLDGCHKINELPKLPESLTTLNVGSSLLQRLPDFSKLAKLNTLKLSDFSDRHTQSKLENRNLKGIEKLAKLSILELHLSNVKNLPENFSTFTHLKVLVIACLGVQYQIPQLPSSLSHLRLQYVDDKTRLPILMNLKSLVWLEFKDCSIENGLGDLGVENLHSLAFFYIDSCSSLSMLNDLKLPRSLESLWICSCNSLRNIFDLSHLRNLKELKLWDCQQLTGVPGLGELFSLEILGIYSCGLERVINLSNLRKLEELEIEGCHNLWLIKGVDDLSLLRKKEIYNCPNLRPIS